MCEYENVKKSTIYLQNINNKYRSFIAILTRHKSSANFKVFLRESHISRVKINLLTKYGTINIHVGEFNKMMSFSAFNVHCSVTVLLHSYIALSLRISF